MGECGWGRFSEGEETGLPFILIMSVFEIILLRAGLREEMR